MRLSAEQLEYAAIDAYASHRVCVQLERMPWRGAPLPRRSTTDRQPIAREAAPAAGAAGAPGDAVPERGAAAPAELSQLLLTVPPDPMERVRRPSVVLQ